MKSPSRLLIPLVAATAAACTTPSVVKPTNPEWTPRPAVTQAPFIDGMKRTTTTRALKKAGATDVSDQLNNVLMALSQHPLRCASGRAAILKTLATMGAKEEEDDYPFARKDCDPSPQPNGKSSCLFLDGQRNLVRLPNGLPVEIVVGRIMEKTAGEATKALHDFLGNDGNIIKIDVELPEGEHAGAVSSTTFPCDQSGTKI